MVGYLVGEGLRLMMSELPKNEENARSTWRLNLVLKTLWAESAEGMDSLREG